MRIILQAPFKGGMDTLRLILAVVGTISLCLVGVVMLRLRRLNSELSKQRGLLETLLNNIPDQIYFKDRQSRFIKINTAVTRFLGIASTEEAVGKTDLDYCRKEEAESYRADDQRVMDSGKPLHDRMERGIIKGKENWMSTTKAPFFDESGKVIGLVGISRDITERVRTEKVLSDVVARARCILWNARVVKIGDEYDWRFSVHSSEDIVKLFALCTEPNSTTLWGVPISDDQMAIMNRNSQGAISRREKGYEQEFWVTLHDGSIRWLKENVQISKVGKSEWDLVGVAIDITERKLMEDLLADANSRLEILARDDALTGLLNRRVILETAEAECARWERFSSRFSMMMIDVDDFKKVNDTYGHETGDEVLKALATLLKSSIRTVDRVGRYGGEEFVIVLPETTQEGAAALGEKILAALRAAPLVNGEVPLMISVSIGIATIQKSDKNVAAMLQRADSAMYNAKRAGKARLVEA